MWKRYCQLPGWRTGWIALALAALTVALRLPLIGDPIDVSPDGCEYLGIARHLAEEGRWVSSIKWHFFTDDPVVHFALADRPPLYPLWAAVWTDGGTIEAQVFRVRLVNIALAAAAVAIAFGLLRRLFPLWIAAGSALLFTTYPAFVRNSAQPLTEPLFLALVLGAFQTFLAPRPRPLLTGVLCGLAYLTRPAGVLPLAVFCAAEILARRGGPAWPPIHRPAASDRGPEDKGAPQPERAATQGRPYAITGMLLGFAAVCLPYWGAVWHHYGSPFYSVLSFNFSIGHIYEGTFYGFERRFPTPMQFVREDPVRVARLIAAQTANLGATIGRSLRYLWLLPLCLRPSDLRRRPLLLAFIALNFAFHALSWTVWGAARYQFPDYLLLTPVLLLRGADIRRHALLLAFIGLNFAFHALSWTVWGAARYQFPGYLFLTPILLEAPVRRFEQSHRRWLGAALAGTALTASLGACALGNVRLFQEKLAPHAGVRLGWAFREAAAWVNAQPWPQPGLCAANYPHMLNLLTRRPAIILPRFQDAAQVRRFLTRYHPGVLIVAIDEPVEAGVADMLLQRPWTARRVRPELASWLEVVRVAMRSRPRALQELGPGRKAYPAQWLIVLRARWNTPFDAKTASNGGPYPSRWNTPFDARAASNGGPYPSSVPEGVSGNPGITKRGVTHGIAAATALSAEHGAVSRDAAAAPHL